MSDRRPDDSVTQQTGARPATPEGHEPLERSEPKLASPGQEPAEDMTQRTNAAYASSAPIPTDDSDGNAKQSGAERFAAVLAAARENARPGTSTTPTPPAASKPAPPPRSAPKAAARPAGQQAGAPRKVRRARLRLTHVDPWSVLKTSFLLSVALGIVTVVAVAVVWMVLDSAGVWESIDRAVGDVVGDTGTSFRIEDYFGLSRVMGFTLLVAVFDVVLISVIATLGAFLYNLAAALLGGLEVVLAEEDR